MPSRNKKPGFLSKMFGNVGTTISPVAKEIGGNYPGQAQQMLTSGSTPQEVIGSIHGHRRGDINLPPMSPVNNGPTMMPPSIVAPSPGMMQQIANMNPFGQFGRQIDASRNLKRGSNVR